MSIQSEQQLEDNLIAQLESLKYKRVKILNEDALLLNLKRQLEIHNDTIFSNFEFKRILNILNKGNVFTKAKILRDQQQIKRDDGSIFYFEFLNTKEWCQNEYQVTNQITIDGKYKNRYDVTILINGLPLVQIELKRRGLELKEAFNQINRYQKHSYNENNALFGYIQIFIISNGKNTKYYANNKNQSFKQTFFWAKEDNTHIKELEEFTNTFLEQCHISKMIGKYIVLAEADKILMVLRPYQFYAVENIVKTAEESVNNGYIWHTTGSGKTLTSFKASQILTNSSKIKKVVFVVDRKDLDYQTTKEFNSFSEGSVDGTDNTKKLVEQFSDDTTPLIVTTIQKLNTAISRDSYLEQMEKLKNEKIVFIFDECHRSQFGETHNRIKDFFDNYQMFGFTGTPIFPENAVRNQLGLRTTEELFDKPLHKYVITDAIRDENVLKFSIEYIQTYKQKDDIADVDVENIDTKEVLESDERIEKIVDYILLNHNRKTHSRNFTAMLCVSGIDVLTKYYDLFKAKEHNLKIATIFSYAANEEDKDADGNNDMLDDDIDMEAKDINKHSQEKLDNYMQDYNEMFGSKYSVRDSKSFYNYYNDIAKRVKNQDIDILIVVNMFLTGFDSKTLNTLYVDKNLKYHGLIQAYSRTNRIINEQKSQGNIVCFRNLKDATDDAVRLFSDKNADENIIIEPYEDYVEKFNLAFLELIKITPTIEGIDNLSDENEEFKFIKAFRTLMRLRNILISFSEFEFDNLSMNEQLFEDYKSKYLDLHDKVKTNRAEEKVSILEDIDFELELVHKDEINVAYILQLLAKLKNMKDGSDKDKQQKSINDMLNNEASLRSKKDLIEKFMNENLIRITSTDMIADEFENFLQDEQKKALKILCENDGLNIEKLQVLIDEYIFTSRKPLGDDIVDTMEVKPKLLKRKKIIASVTDKVLEFVDRFYER
jgi:type I restriction enzyme R subunit